MFTGLSAPVRRHPLVSFFLLAFGITWLAAIPFALGIWPGPMFPFGPLVAALIVGAASDGWAGIKSLLLSMLRWRVSPKWYAFALLLPIAVTLAAAYGTVLTFGAADPTAVILAGLPGYLPLFALMMLNPLQGTFGEEPGWRGYALPRLLSDRSPLAASVLLGALVAGWHAPLFVIGAYTNVVVHVLFIFITTVLYTLMFGGTRGSVLLAMIFHTGWNLAPEFVVPAFQGAVLEQALRLSPLNSHRNERYPCVCPGRLHLGEAKMLLNYQLSLRQSPQLTELLDFITCRSSLWSAWLKRSWRSESELARQRECR
jgi:membrane protease YdiL (CAAX protease family)